ncbi:hypothetical protein HW115_19155 [Verrucomicrobiaceae bacterium N1E253]|uniref:Uncharacterized protein n=1 Tax=Oceaniferula marina TaxID=2748318 RepID=A0A851GRK0_9BACT|nr:hypothetical protein [Oceaniferula marina]NWK57745.1 hypothetical protein [Oceaniferula marina]
MRTMILLAVICSIVSCDSRQVEDGLASGSLDKTVYFTKRGDGSVFYAIFPSPIWKSITTTMQSDPIIPSKGILIQPHVKNGLWVNGSRKYIPTSGGAFYLGRSGDLIVLDVSQSDLNMIAAEDGIELAERILAEQYKAEQVEAPDS